MSTWLTFFAFSVGLERYEVPTEDTRNFLFDLIDAFGQNNTVRTGFFDSSFTTTTRMNLGFDDVPRGTGFFCELFSSRHCSFNTVNNNTFLNGYAIFFENCFSLEFV